MHEDDTFDVKLEEMEHWHLTLREMATECDEQGEQDLSKMYSFISELLYNHLIKETYGNKSPIFEN